MILSFFTRLYEAIKRGILRIFPLPLKPIIYVLLTLTILTFYGCASTHHVSQLVEQVSRDTIYISNVKHDSVYLNHERLIDRSKDTVYIKDVSVEYKYRLLRDTIKVTQRDSIPYEVTIVETKEITRPLTWYDHLTRLTFWFVFGYLLSVIVFKLKSLIPHL